MAGAVRLGAPTLSSALHSLGAQFSVSGLSSTCARAAKPQTMPASAAESATVRAIRIIVLLPRLARGAFRRFVRLPAPILPHSPPAGIPPFAPACYRHEPVFAAP